MTEAQPALPDKANIIALPPLIYLVCAAVGFALEYFWPQGFIAAPLRYWVGGALLVCVFVIFGFALREFRRAKTSVDPRKPTTAIIVRGLYRFTRNPIYMSDNLLLIGIAMLADSLWVLLSVIPAVLIIHFFVILREEAYLTRKFGAEYDVYKLRVRRWI